MSAIDLAGPLPGVVYEKREGIAILRLDRVARGNALTPAMQPVIRAIWEDVRDDPAVRVAIVAASGERHFCTGFDVAEAGGVHERRLAVLVRRARVGAAPHQQRRGRGVPVGAGVVQRRQAVEAVARLGLGAAVAEELAQRRVAVHRRDVQRRPAAQPAQVLMRRRAAIERFRRRRDAVPLDRVVQRRRLPVRLRAAARLAPPRRRRGPRRRHRRHLDGHPQRCW